MVMSRVDLGCLLPTPTHPGVAGFLILSPHPEHSSGRSPGPVFPLSTTSLPAPTPGFLFGRSASAPPI